jgi:hypothetical protein
MTRASRSLRRWTALLALVAIASLGLAVHGHSAASISTALAIEAAADPAADGHEPGDCLACRAHGRDPLASAPAGSATLAFSGPSLVVDAIDAPTPRSAESRPPTPPRGPPLPTS